MAISPDIFALFGAARWTPDGGESFAVAASMSQEAYERRLVARKRVYLDGAPLDDTGEDPGVFTLTLLFANGHRNPSVPDPAYPDYHRRFVRVARQGGTGTLYYPGLGDIRCRIKSIVSRKTPGERDSEMVDLTFWADLEDGRITAESFTAPSAKTAPTILGPRLLSTARVAGAGGDLLGSIEGAVSRLQAAVNAPFDAVMQIQLRSAGIVDTLGRLEQRLVNAPRYYGSGSYSVFGDARSAPALVSLAQLKESTARQTSASQGDAPLVQRRFQHPMSIFAIARTLGQDASELVRINPALPSVTRIPAGTPVWTKA